jgi:hypothetical protein
MQKDNTIESSNILERLSHDEAEHLISRKKMIQKVLSNVEKQGAVSAFHRRKIARIRKHLSEDTTWSVFDAHMKDVLRGFDRGYVLRLLQRLICFFKDPLKSALLDAMKESSKNMLIQEMRSALQDFEEKTKVRFVDYQVRMDEVIAENQRLKEELSEFAVFKDSIDFEHADATLIEDGSIHLGDSLDWDASALSQRSFDVSFGAVS